MNLLMLMMVLAPAAEPKPDLSKVPGVVVTHSPASTRQYLGSPSLTWTPDRKRLLISHDFFGPGSTRDTTVVFASDDSGKTWKESARMKGQWWSTLATLPSQGGSVFLIGTSKEYGSTVIRKWHDGQWTEPKDADTGLLLGTGMYHCAPVPLVEHRGRIWRAMEAYTGPKWGAFEAFVMSAPADANLLQAKSWTSTNRLKGDPKWLNGTFGGWLEGNVVVDPQGKVVSILRVHQPGYPEKAAMVRISDDGKTASFDPERDFIDFPGGGKKFTIRHDPRSGRYWSLANYVPKTYEGLRPDMRRNTLALISSTDLRHWDVNRIVMQNPDVLKHGFQYVDWHFDGDDMIAAIRTAHDDGLSGAHNAHDANFILFKRIEQFRTSP